MPGRGLAPRIQGLMRAALPLRNSLSSPQMVLGTVRELELRAGLRMLKPKLPEEEEAPVWKDE